MQLRCLQSFQTFIPLVGIHTGSSRSPYLVMIFGYTFFHLGLFLFGILYHNMLYLQRISSPSCVASKLWIYLPFVNCIHLNRKYISAFTHAITCLFSALSVQCIEKYYYYYYYYIYIYIFLFIFFFFYLIIIDILHIQHLQF